VRPTIDATDRPASPEPVETTPEVGDAAAPPFTEDDTTGDGERPWWDDPRMPWKGEPTRADIACWVGFSITGLYALVLLPLRPILLGANPYLLAALGGSRTSAVTIGALAATGIGYWPIGLVLGTLGAVKFDWLYWWAGRLWGRGLIELVAGRSARAARNADRAERLARKFGVWAIMLGYVIPLLPSAVVYATVAAAGMRLRKFLIVDIASAAVTRALYIYLGYRIGEPAVNVVQLIAKYSWWISIVLLVGIFGNMGWQAHLRRRNGEAVQASTK
jgi:membrane protein DedA with SNARE-associated domain